MNPQTTSILIPVNFQPEKLRKLLTPGNTSSAAEQILVSERYENDRFGPNYEYAHMLMAAVPEECLDAFGIPREAGEGVVAHSTPYVTEKGGCRTYSPSVSGHDYIVASWGTGSYFGFSLADKVWMTLGLTPRSIGGDHQKLIYDDLEKPIFAVAQGEVSNEYYWIQKRNVRWTMRNDYLRKYLWMRNLIGVRVFYYETDLDDVPDLRQLMNEETDITVKSECGKLEYRLMEHMGRLRLQVTAAIPCVDTALCNTPSTDGLLWPGHRSPMNHAKANALIHEEHVFLKDTFLERYEQNSIFNTVPFKYGETWSCSPSYGGQWGFTQCIRVGRNIIKVPIRELYMPKPDAEICHAHYHSISELEAKSFGLDQEHIVEKTDAFLAELLRLADSLFAFASELEISTCSEELCGFNRHEISNNGWTNYPRLCELAEVAPLEMTEKKFLSRCKLLNEIIQKIPNGKIRKILIAMGANARDIKNLQSLKLLQGIYTVVDKLNENGENVQALKGGAINIDILVSQKAMAPLFVNNDLRNADAHAITQTVQTCLTSLDFDVALLNDGYGLATDFMFDQITETLKIFASQCEQILERD
ncbi:hypothetical protein [uncultured Sneathiella sp.]|uniref:hypothetical protein n=1 Tax=uncultured Sneathiella sp. TaxID=879315 RepID=UPI0030D85F0B|tara:strand:+ start:9221 stop:10984 length:1764 start_codon:yes stop_codon:yes gene_type:complete